MIFLRYGGKKTDGLTDVPKKWYIEVFNISNRAQLYLGWKKKLNQILLSKHWHIGQIYTIPKFIKEEIEKTIAQVSNGRFGLGILDKNTQLHSVELQWIQRLLNPTNALWKGFMLYSLNLKNNSNQGLCLFRFFRKYNTFYWVKCDADNKTQSFQMWPKPFIKSFTSSSGSSVQIN